MRVIAGLARGRKLLVPQHGGTRPTPDRVREALFSALAPQLPGASVLDLFAGSGALGIEASSRGAAVATFVENDVRALRVLRQNLTVLPAAQQASCTVRAQAVLLALTQLQHQGARFSLIFADAPYDAQALPEVLARLAAGKLLTQDGSIVVEHARHQAVPPAPEGLSCLRTRLYGEVALSTYVSYTVEGDTH